MNHMQITFVPFISEENISRIILTSHWPELCHMIINWPINYHGKWSHWFTRFSPRPASPEVHGHSNGEQSQGLVCQQGIRKKCYWIDDYTYWKNTELETQRNVSVEYNRTLKMQIAEISLPYMFCKGVITRSTEKITFILISECFYKRKHSKIFTLLPRSGHILQTFNKLLIKIKPCT